ncbi:MAG: OB-fold domain-containing protein [Burkholderiaceae bacterium]
MTTPTISARSPAAQAFVDGLARGVLRVQACEACSTVQSLARHACPRCGSPRLSWRNASGLGTVFALTQVRRAPTPEFRALVPYTLVLVDLDEGARVMGHAADGLSIGDRVRAEFFEHDARPLLRFVPG